MPDAMSYIFDDMDNFCNFSFNPIYQPLDEVAANFDEFRWESFEPIENSIPRSYGIFFDGIPVLIDEID